MVSLDNEMHMSILDVIQIRKSTTWCCVSIPTSTSFLVGTKDSKWSTRCLGVSRKD